MRWLPDKLAIVGALSAITTLGVLLWIVVLDRLEDKTTSWWTWAGMIAMLYVLTGLDLLRFFRGGNGKGD